jgi:class 3 adenylate cyclase
MLPDVAYTRSGDLLVAYQVVGSPGQVDVVLVHGWAMAFQCGWEERHLARFYGGLSQKARLILFDPRGTGLSDKVTIGDLPDLETRMDDLRATLDAAGSERAVIFGIGAASQMCVLFAATYPHRTSALILHCPVPRSLWAPDWLSGTRPEDRRLEEAVARDGWRREYLLEYLRRAAPSLAEDDAFVEWWIRSIRLTLSPAANTAYDLMVDETDVRAVLPSVRVPTLVLCPDGDEKYGPGARYVAERIPGAELAEFAGTDHVPWAKDQGSVLGLTEAFLDGVRDDADLGRVVATVLFTDIVGSTERAATLGDRGWSELLEAHHRMVRGQLARFRGHEVDTAGDGFLATFDGPARAIRCACAISTAVAELGLAVRAGLHTGECELAEGEVRGVSVHIGARVQALAAPGEVLVSSTVKELVAGSGFEFADRGTHELRGVPGEWHLHAVVR